MTQALIFQQTETSLVTTIDWVQPNWKETSLLSDRVVENIHAKTYIFSDSVVCLGGMSTEPVHTWKKKIQWLLDTDYFKELDRIDVELVELE